MKKLLTLFLTVFLIFASCKNQNFVEYIEKGFAKPTVNDVQFNKFSLGDKNKIYVPSEQEIEIELTIKNKYEKEIIGTLQLPEDKKAFFHTVPHIKSLTNTKMVIAFKFKEESEPSYQNNFLGASVPLDLKIYDKKSNRLFSSQNINANCNTAPPSVPENKIVYKPETDEYVIELPKNENIHNDLKEVKLLLSSKYGTEGVKTSTISINTSTEGSLHTLTIKGNQEGQLTTPLGIRKLEVIVYDKAGLNSSSHKTSEIKRFTTITLEPQNDDVDLNYAKTKGAIVPKIKELVDYFQTKQNWEDAGYTVSYESNDFVYDTSKNPHVFMPKNPTTLTRGTYNVIVKLSGGNISPSPLTKTYTINILGDNEAGIKTSELRITDETTYSTFEYPKLIIPPVVFENDGSNGKKCEVIVPFTDSKTNLKVHVEAIGSNGKIKQTPSDALEAKERDFDVELEKPYGTEKTLIFYAYSSDGTINKKYTMKFIRGESVNVNVSVANELLQSDNCKVKMSWNYGVKEISISKEQIGLSTESFDVAKGAGVTFKITAGEGDRIKECSSTEHPPITIDNPKTKSFELVANQNFVLNVTFRAEASFKWADINASDSQGYKNANVSYYLNNIAQNDSYPSSTTTISPEKAMQKGKECKFWIEWADNATKRKVSAWFVNSEPITISKPDGSIVLNEDKTSLTIKNVNKDYVVKVCTVQVYELTIKISDGVNDITDHGYTFEVKDNTSGGTEIPAFSFGKYIGIMGNTQVNITAIKAPNSKYDIDKWKSQTEDETTPTELTGNEIDKRSLTITKNTVVKLILKKKTFKIEWNVEGGDQNTSLPELNTSIKLNGGIASPQSSAYVEIGKNAVFEVDPLETERTIKGWKVDDVLYENSNSGKKITISTDKKTLTLSDVRKTYIVVLVLEIVKHTITFKIEGPIDCESSEVDKYTIVATENNIPKSENPGTKYTYSGIIHSENSTCKFKAERNGSIYEIGKWKYYDESSGKWQPYTTAQYEDDPSFPNGKNPAILKIAPNNDLKLKLVLKHKPIEFKIIKREGLNHGKLQIRKVKTGEPIAQVETSGIPKYVDIETKEKTFFLNIADIFPNSNDYKILHWKVNEVEDNRFLYTNGNNKGFWKGAGSSELVEVKLKSDDKLSVTVSNMVKIQFMVEYNNATFNGEYKITVKKSEGQPVEKILLPVGRIEINKDSKNERRCIYAIENTKIDVKLELPSDKKLRLWMIGNEPLHEPWNKKINPYDPYTGEMEVKDYTIKKDVVHRKYIYAILDDN